LEGKRKIGEVEHYYNHLGVAVVKLSASLRVGDKILVENRRGQPVLEQAVDSMQVEHQNISEAKPGQSIGLRVVEKVHQGNAVYKV